MQYPIKGKLHKEFRITSPFGPRTHPITGKKDNHNGVDLVMTDGSTDVPIVAPEPGKIMAARKSAAPGGGYGYYVKMQGDSGVVHLMAHLDANSIKVKPGERVSRGRVIGNMGTTGASTGVHLHWEVRKDGRFTNPIAWVSDNASPELPEEFKAWTKRKPNNSASVHIKDAPYGSKVRIRHNGESVFVKTIRNPEDKGLGKTITFNEGKNVIEIFVDEVEVHRVAYTKKSNSEGTITPPEVEKPITDDSAEPYQSNFLKVILKFIMLFFKGMNK